MDTPRLRYAELTDTVWLSLGEEDLPLGTLETARDACPDELADELALLIDSVRDGRRFAAACEREALVTDLDPSRW